MERKFWATIYCDHDECDASEVLYPDAHNYHAAMAKALQAGWKVDNGSHFCSEACQKTHYGSHIPSQTG